ncbi:hypothetical protein FHS78_002784 [Parvibaculum indicum]|uniref:hypothetical protein n=1 Tax=Parvibaculum indicum TaxID=562969 RepID=UPI00142460EE|nr:hypothetical protein [Parvibaculum indicum]NIJ42482.1 hypothetical protein [Parvibaculum indicum]
MKKALLGCLCIALLAGCKDNSSPSTSTSGTSSLGLELAGDQGLVTALAGSDMLGAATGTAGAVNDLIGGTNPLMEQLIPVMEALQPIGVPLDQLVEGSITPALSQLSDPGLGASGPDSPVTQLLGGDILGSLIGTEEGAVPVIVAGTDGGILGALLQPVTDNLPAEASLAPVTQPLIAALSGSGAGDLSGGLGDLGGFGALPGLDGAGLDGAGLDGAGLDGAGLGGAGLGVTGETGLIGDLLGTDPVGALIAPVTPVADLLDGGNEGLLGNLVPAGN